MPPPAPDSTLPRPTDIDRVAIIGAGAWGTALAMVVQRAGRAAMIWAREPEVAEAINADNINPVFLPGVTLDPGIRAHTDIAGALEGATVALLVTPAQHLRSIAAEVGRNVAEKFPLVICSKGIEGETGALPSEIVAAEAPHTRPAILSGPTFAAEVAQGLPTAVTLAAANPLLAERLALLFAGTAFRPYVSADPVGAQIGGAIKNVIAIACGITVGRKLGENARAALITRGLAEMVRLGVAKGAAPETLMGLSGLGDLTLTCNSLQSRNMSLGAALGEGRRLDDILGERKSVAEGVWTAASVSALARSLDIEMPISTAIDAILHHGASVDAVIEGLLARPIKAEIAT